MAKLIKNLTFGFDDGNKLVKLPHLVLFITLILTLGVTFLFYRNAVSRDYIRFKNSTTRIEETLKNRIDLQIALLQSTRAFVDTTENLNRKKFKTFVDSLELKKNYVGVIGIGFNKFVPANQKESLKNQLKTEYSADIKIFPEGEREFYSVVIYFEPLEDIFQQFIGYDMLTDESRRQAILRARDTSTASATNNTILLVDRETSRQSGFLIFLPVYKSATEPLTVEERRKNIIGFVYSPFRAKEFLDAAIGENSFPEVEFKLYDDSVKEENLLAQTDSARNRNLADESENKGLYGTSLIKVGGRNWILEYSPTNEFIKNSNNRLTPTIFIVGVVFSILLFIITNSQIKSRRKLKKIAVDLLEVEQEKQILYENEQRARRIAEQANQTKDEFIASVSHELRTPLNAIAGWARILKSENLSDQTREMALEKIEKSLRLQTKLVEDLLSFSEIISGKVNLENETFSFSDVFENVVSEYEPKANEKEIEFIKINRLDGQKTLGDRQKIKMVIENLISNAIKFTHSGGKIETEVFEEEDKICLKIKDNGSGINREFLPHIFDRFRQEDASSTKFYGGLGLGLAISSHIVKLHNGTIEAQSEGSEKGAIFTVKLPVQK